MTKRKGTTKQKAQQQLQQIRSSNFQLIKQKLSKKKLDLARILEKKDMHNILNSYLIGDIFEQDILNQFWQYYFKKPASLKDISKAYADSIVMLLDKILTSNQRIYDLTKQKQKYNQNHDYKGKNATNLQILQLTQQKDQYKSDLNQFSRPFSFNFTPIIQKYKSQNMIKDKQKTVLVQREHQLNLSRVTSKQKTDSDEISQDWLQLTVQQKYYRFMVYLLVIIFVMELSVSFGKFNMVDLLFTLVLLGNGLMEDYLFKNSQINKEFKLVSFNHIDNCIEIKDQKQAFAKFKSQEETEKIHNFDKFSNYSLAIIFPLLLWNITWLLLMKYLYFDSSSFQGTTYISSLWKYSRYVYYASAVSCFFKFIVFLLLLKLTNLCPQVLLSKFNLYLPFVRWSNYHYLLDFTENK